MTVRIIEHETIKNQYLQGIDSDASFVTNVVETLRIVTEFEEKVIFHPVETVKVFNVGIQGPPGIAGDGSGGWTYVQDGVPAGTDGQTWYQPSTQYGYTYRLNAWERFLYEGMTADNTDHNIQANGGYY